jgi:hypothetical protein
MSAISITKPHDLLSAKIGRDTAQDLTHYMEDKVKEELDNNIQVLATKEDIASTKDEFTRLDVKIYDTKSELIK